MIYVFFLFNFVIVNLKGGGGRRPLREGAVQGVGKGRLFNLTTSQNDVMLREKRALCGNKAVFVWSPKRFS